MAFARVWKIAAGAVAFFVEPGLTFAVLVAAVYGFAWVINALGAVVARTLHVPL